MQLVALLPSPPSPAVFIDFYFIPRKQRKSVCCRMLHAHKKSCICILPLTYLYLTALLNADCCVIFYIFFIIF